ncbi:MAG: flagellar protein FlaG [Gammaproteobacteria bacterium]|nr:flagellar protein FlaG [Gammaproteobacteria bacterium]
MKAITNSELAGVNSFRRTATKDDARAGTLQPASPAAADKLRVDSGDKRIDDVKNGSELASKLTSLPQIVKRNIQFSIDEDTGQSVFRVVESDTGKLIRQIPSDQILQIMQQVQEAQGDMMRGILLDDRT